MSTENRDIISDIHFDETAREHIRTAATWAKIIAIVAFASYAINLLVAFAGKTAADYSTGSSGLPFMATRMSTISYTLFTVIIGVIINLFLLRFATKAKEGVDRLNQTSLETGMNGLGAYFKIAGIILIVLVALVLIAMIFVITMDVSKVFNP